MFGNNLHFCEKSKIWLNNQNIGGNLKLGKKSNFWGKSKRSSKIEIYALIISHKKPQTSRRPFKIYFFAKNLPGQKLKFSEKM